MLTIPFDLSIYSQAAIHDALLAYRAFCQITAKFTENQCICTLRQSKYDMQQTAYEFANYVLSSTVQKEGTRCRCRMFFCLHFASALAVFALLQIAE